jgi:hypothetical protein
VPRREQVVVHDLADAVVDQLEAVADLAEQPVAHEVLDTLGLLLVEARRARQ